MPGRKTGRLYSTPVDIIESDGQQWLIAGYGPSAWTKNVLAAGEVTLSRGGNSSRFAAEITNENAAVSALRTYIDTIRVTRPYFDARADSPDDEVARELARHPVFRLVPLDAKAPDGPVSGTGRR